MLKRMISRRGWWALLFVGMLSGFIVTRGVQQGSTFWVVGGVALLTVSCLVDIWVR